MAYLANSLVVLRNEVNASNPNRDKGSDGWIGDAAHQARVSDHNPDKKGCVHAADFDKDGIDPDRLVSVAIKHPSCAYVIWNRTIWERDRNFAAHAYTGDDPHTGHAHVSINYTSAAENSGQAWGYYGASPSGPVLHRAWPSYMKSGHYFGLITGPNASHGGYYANERPDVKAIQQRLIQLGYVVGVSNVNAGWADGKFEQPTKNSVARWQHDHYAAQTSRFGEVWSDDWARLFTY